MEWQLHWYAHFINGGRNMITFTANAILHVEHWHALHVDCSNGPNWALLALLFIISVGYVFFIHVTSQSNGGLIGVILYFVQISVRHLHVPAGCMHIRLSFFHAFSWMCSF
jgi:hypothetical protein